MFSFSPTEVGQMSLSDLLYWHRRAVLYAERRAQAMQVA